MNKKIIYLSIFLILALFLISACSQVKGVKTETKKVVSEETTGDEPISLPFRYNCKLPSGGFYGSTCESNRELSYSGPTGGSYAWCDDVARGCREDGGTLTMYYP
jgi:hypothetical protein